MPVRTPIRIAVAAMALSVASAHALERITLANGFTIDCARHEPTQDGYVRLVYRPSAPGAEEGVQLLRASEIASIDPLPDPPAEPTPAPLAPAAAPIAVRDLLARAGTQHNIDVELLASVVHTESSGNVHAVSRAGARGLMQLMPATAQQHGVTNAFEPAQNISGGTAYLDELLTRYHNDLTLALAAYNAGPAAVDRYHGVPPYRETRAYVARVENEFIRRKAALKKQTEVSGATHPIATATHP